MRLAGLVVLAGLLVSCQGDGPESHSADSVGVAPGTSAAAGSAGGGSAGTTGSRAAGSGGTAGQQRIEFLGPDSSAYPFSPAVRVGGFLFLSGQIGSRTEGGRMVLVPGGVEAETRQTMDNIDAILKQNGSSLERVVKCTVMIADMADWPRINTVYATYFPGRKPARSALGANGLALGARVEIECIAAV